MSGHSKWANIKHKKAKVDAQKGVVFQKFSREIIIAAKLGGADLNGNFRLRTAVDKAKAAGLPNDNIKRAIEKGSGMLGADNYEEITYEGYGASGVAVFIEAMTDNKNRTAGDIRSFFTRFKGSLGENGCVSWMFKKVGIIYFEKSDDKLIEEAINLGAEDFIEEDDEFKIITDVENLQAVVEGLEKLNFKPTSAELTRLPQNTITVDNLDSANNIIKLLDRIEEHDDVQNVYSNFEFTPEIEEQLDL